MLRSEAIQKMQDNHAAMMGAQPDDPTPEEETDAVEAEPDEEEPSDENAEPEGEEAEASAEAEAGEEPESEEEPDPIPDAPEYWPQDRIDHWASLSPEAREVFISQTADIQHKIASEAGRKAAEAKREAERVAEAEKAAYTQKITQLDALIPQLEIRAQSKYANVDWTQLARENPEDFNVLRSEYEQDNAVYNQAVKARNDAQEEQRQREEREARQRQDDDYQSFLQRNPQFRGPDGETKLRTEVFKVQEYGKTLGYTEEDFKRMTSRDFEVLRDAMEYRTLKRTAASPAKKKPAPAQVAVKPAARKAAVDPAKKREQDARDRFNKSKASGSTQAQIKAAANLLLARQKGA